MNTLLLNTGEGLLPSRVTTARTVMLMALFCAPALLLLHKGWSAFGVLLLLCTALGFGSWRAACRPAAKVLAALLLMALLVLALALVSMQQSGQGLRSVDYVARLLLLPWCAAVAYALSPPRALLWWGAMAGIVLGFALACMQVMQGADRAGAGSNPIVFANAMLTLLVLAIHCLPARSSFWRVLALLAILSLGMAAIVMSGSRGVLPGLAAMLLIAIIGGGRGFWLRSGIAVALLASVLAALWFVPALAERSRLAEVRTDLHAYARGHVDTPIGARLEYLALAGEAFAERPWTGVGLDRFDTRIRTIPACRQQSLGVCGMGHAHNDLAQWSATLGVPGLLSILAIYLLPLALLLRLALAMPGTRTVGAAWAGAVLVLTYMLSGLTQSMFAHALTTTNYAVLVGLLIGIALGEAEAARAPGAQRQGAAMQ